MPKVARGRKKKPAGWDIVEATLNDFADEMREGMCRR
jgi:hypothetical protein